MKLRFPKSSKYKYSHSYSSINGKKGFGRIDKKAIIIKTQESNLFSPRQYEMARRILAPIRKEKRSALKFRFFPNLSISKKPLQTRMGKGKGKPHGWVAPLKKGTPLFEFAAVLPLKKIKKIYKRIAYRLPVFSKMVIKKKNKYRISNKIPTQQLILK